jgi:N-acetylneuraminic acid mutarotase
MKKIFIFLILTLIVMGQTPAQTSVIATWMSGDNIPNQLGVYGTKGVPSSTNKPGSRYGSVSWKDASGNLWLFGGYIYRGNNYTVAERNDLWKYDLASNLWTWVSGDNVPGQPAVYGTKGVPSPENKPGARELAASWTDAEGNFWLFGGGGYGENSYGYLNDLWKYDPVKNQWTWVSGDKSANSQAVYGTQGISSSTNKPGARWSTSSWIDDKGNLWLFGGLGNTARSGGYLNDLWRYNPTNNEWTWMSGDSVDYQPGIYGIKGSAAPDNQPGSRYFAMSWKDAFGNFWLFGGSVYSKEDGISRTFNDLWKYDSGTNQWSWMNGDSVLNQPGIYGLKGIAAPDNKPGGRYNAVDLTDIEGNFWLFGGSNRPTPYTSDDLNDWWKYDPAANLWTWMGGDNFPNQFGVYGISGVPSFTNKPGARRGAVG